MFLGVPYAEPPIGNLRFRSPVRPQRWSAVREVSTLPRACIQNNDWLQGKFQDDSYTPSEDCLYLNVYVPGSRNLSNANAPTDLAVMVWIHGGEFQRGTASLYDPSRLVASNNVIVVTVNYRLGVLGFLSLQTGDIGNYGMRDQTAALAWIQRNIAAFGGDKNIVTLFGHEAGAASILSHLASEKSQGMFSRAICQSVMPTALQYPPRNTTLLLAGYLRCATPDVDDMLTCMRSRNIDELYASVSKINTQLSLGDTNIFGPSEGDDWIKFPPNYNFTRGAYNRHIQIVMGTSSSEGIGKLYATMSRKTFEANVDALAVSLQVSDHKKVSRMIFSRYLRDQVDGDYRPAVAAVSNDIITALAQDRARTLSKHGTRVFNYRFSHQASFAPTPWYLASDHDDFAPFVLGQFAKFSDDEKLLSTQVMTAWAYFAKSGTPKFSRKTSLDWQPYTTLNQSYIDLRIPLGPASKRSRLKEAADIFWNEIVQTFKSITTPPTERPVRKTTQRPTEPGEPRGKLFGWTNAQSEIAHLTLLVIAGVCVLVCIFVVACHVCLRKREVKRNNMYNVETKTDHLRPSALATENGKDVTSPM